MRRLALSVVVVLCGAGQCRGDITGYLLAWGRDDNGQLAVLPGEDYVAIAAGGNHTLVIREDGTLAAWGVNNDNQCNVPDTSGFESIAAGHVHSLARRNDGTLAAWGNNTHGQGTLGPAGNDFVEVDAGIYYSLALREDGTIEAWGMNNQGQCDVPDGNDFLAVTGGHEHGVALRQDGSLVAWGSNEFQQLEIPAGRDFVAIDAGFFHTVALRRNGTLAAWGWNAWGQCDVPQGDDFISVSAGSSHNIALKNDSSLVLWGANVHGQCDAPAGNGFLAVAAGQGHSVALRATNRGNVLNWDELGDGTWSESHWLSDIGQPVHVYPDDDQVFVLVRENTVDVTADYRVLRLAVVSGTVAIADGTTLSANDLVEVYDAASIVLGADATLQGDLLAQGTLASTQGYGQLTIAGELTMANNANYTCDVGQTEGAGGSDHLVVQGGLELHANTTLTFDISGTSPFKAGTYPVVTFENITGKFVSSSSLGRYAADGPNLNGLHYGDKTLTVTIEWDLNQGDANLNGKTDVQDFNLWNASKFESDTDWGTGDFNGDGLTDVRDFNQWNAAKFTAAWDKSSEGQVPEPGVLVLLAAGLLGLVVYGLRSTFWLVKETTS